MYDRCNENPLFIDFQKKLLDKKMSLNQFSKIVGYTRGGVYKVFQFNRKSKLEEFFNKLNSI